MRKIIGLLFNFFYNIIIPPPKFTQKGRGNYIRFCNGRFINGKNNRIIINNNCSLNRCQFFISGNNNTIIIGNECRLSKMIFWMQDDNNTIIVGDKTSIGERTGLTTLEGTKIEIGKDCMLSFDISVRTSDSHSIMDENGNRINNAKDITIGNHCWIGSECLILKGTSLGDNSILGARSILTKQYTATNCVLTGAPAKVIRENVNWDRKRL